MENERRRMKKMQLSSSRRETTTENRCPTKKSIGCMSGILQFLSRHHSRRCIPSAVRKELKIETPSLTSMPAPPPPGCAELKTVLTPKNDDTELHAGSGCGGLVRRSTCEVPRSPTLPSEIRRSGGCFDPLDSPRRPPALVARLMGLVDPPPTPSVVPPVAVSSLESAEEKRRKLLGALERCDEDLRALKRIIDAVRTAENLRWKAGCGEFDGGDPPAQKTMGGQLDANGEQQPSPVSVLDALSSPKFENASSVVAGGSVLPVFSEDVQKKAWGWIAASCSLHRRMTIEGRIPRLPAAAKAGSIPTAAKAFGGGRWRWRRSHAMVESVGEVAEEAVFEERNEFGRVGVELVDDVVEDLIDEFFMELVDCCCHKLSLQRLIRCRRKLCF